VTAIIVLLAVPMLLVGVFLVRGAIAGWPAVAQVVRVARRRVASIDPAALEGRVAEVAGAIGVEGDACTSAEGDAAAWVRVKVASRQGDGDDAKALGERTAERGASALVRDDTGACRLDLEHAVVVAERRAGAGPVDALRATAPPWILELVHEDATHVTVDEEIVPVGARVLASGLVRPVIAAEREASGYRDARPRVLVELHGAEEQRVLLASGGEAGFVARALVPMVASALVGLYLCAFAATVVAAVLFD
jgi:hypothetical protein